MATIRVRSTDGSNADNGTTWALAKADLVGAAAIDAAGDTIYVSQAHSETTAAAITIALAGTMASPVNVLCVNDAADPPTAEATTAVVATTASGGHMTITGSAYFKGIRFEFGSSTFPVYMSQCSPTVAAEKQHYEACQFANLGAGAAGRVDIGTGAASAIPSRVDWTDCDVSFAHASQGIAATGVAFTWRGGAVLSGSTALTGGLVKAPNTKNQRPATAHIEAVDLSELGSASFIFDAATTAVMLGTLINCKLPGSWTGALTTGALAAGQRFEMWNCDSGDTNYRLWIEDYCGSIRDETTIKMTGGASDGVTGYSWKMVTSANAEFPLQELASPWQFIPNSSTSSLTVEAEVVTDGVTLKTSEARLEVQYLGTSGNPLGVVAHDGETNTLTGLAGTSSDQSTSAESWTTTGLSSPVTQKLGVTFTPAKAGAFRARVLVSRASTTVYVNPPAKV